MSTKNYQFVQNTKCEFFPCHLQAAREEFNCLFCYCPLYCLGKDCGGNFTIKNGIKNCTSCNLPHIKGGYDFIMSKISKVKDILVL